jgi:hypothetical protein
MRPQAQPKVEVSRTSSGVHIVIDGCGTIPDSVTIANHSSLRQVFQRDHLIGEPGFDERWHIGGDVGAALALLSDSVRKHMDALGAKCELRIDHGRVEADANEHDLVEVGLLVKELTTLAEELTVTRKEIRKRLERYAKRHHDPDIRQRAAEQLAELAKN